MLPQITIQLYSVRNQILTDFEGTIREISEMGFENVEAAGFPGTSAEKAATIFTKFGIKVPSCHGALPIGENKNQIIEEALILGTRYIITGVPPNHKESYKTLDTIKTMTDLYCEAAENAAPYGIQIGYHNHNWDLIEVDGKHAYRTFIENTPDTVLWEADIFWIAKAGLNPVDFIKEIGPRGKLLHFKDGALDVAEFNASNTDHPEIIPTEESPFLPAGMGDIDLIAAGKVTNHTEYIAVELDSFNGDMMQAVQRSYTYLTSNGIARGKN